MRSEDEIIRAHDLLAGVVLGETGPLPTENTYVALIGALDVLCWVLGHDHNSSFAANLQSLERYIEAQGCKLSREVIQ